MHRGWLGGIALLFLVSACGDDEDDAEPMASKPNEQAAILVTQQTIQAVSSLTGNQASASGLGAANALGNAAQQTQNVVQPDFGVGDEDEAEEDEEHGDGTATQSLGALVHLDAFRPLTTPPGYTGTCECTETSCTFTACKGPSLTIDGTYSWGGGKLKATALKYTVSTASTAGDMSLTTDATWTIDCDMTVSPTAIDGTFRTSGTSNQTAGKNNVDASWNTTLTFKQVTFAANNLVPASGSEHVSSTVNAMVNGGAYTYRGDFDVTFPK